MRRLSLISLLLGLLTLFLPAVSAQECDAAALSQHLSDFAVTIREEQNAVETLNEMADWVEANRLPCQEQALRLPPLYSVPDEQLAFSFTSIEEGEQAVIGPLTIPDGFYRVRLISSAQAMIQVVEREGTCTIINTSREGFHIRNVFYRDQSAEVAEFLFDATACEALLITEELGINPWQLDFYILDLTKTSPAEPIYSSDVLGTSPLIGPVVFEDGVYTATLTNSTPRVYLFPIEGDCGLLPPNRLFSPKEGETEAETEFETQGCVAFIAFELSDREWQLEFEPGR